MESLILVAWVVLGGALGFWGNPNLALFLALALALLEAGGGEFGHSGGSLRYGASFRISL
jgi:hypothetical protein